MRRMLLALVCIAVFVSCKTVPAPIDTTQTDALINQVQDQTNAIHTNAQNAASHASDLANDIGSITVDNVTAEKLSDAQNKAKSLAAENIGLVAQIGGLNATIVNMKASHEADNQAAAQSIADAQKNESIEKAKAAFWRTVAIVLGCAFVLIVGLGALIVFVKK